MPIYKAQGKINLFLHVTNKHKDNNFHELESLCVFSSIGDNIRIEKSANFSITSDGLFAKNLPNTRNNIMAEVFFYLKEAFILQDNISIVIEKNLPVGAGIGGGSANAGVVIKAVNELFSLRLSLQNMMDIGLQFGSDIPICLVSESLFFKGKGEIIEKTQINFDIYAILINPLVTTSTKEVFVNLEHNLPNFSDKIEPSQYNNFNFTNFNQLEILLNNTRNDLRETTFKLCKKTKDTFAILQSLNLKYLQMSGSGSTFFTIFASKNERDEALLNIRKRLPNIWVEPCILS